MFLKVPEIIIIRIGENNVFGPIYIGFVGWNMVYLTFLVHYS